MLLSPHDRTNGTCGISDIQWSVIPLREGRTEERINVEASRSAASVARGGDSSRYIPASDKYGDDLDGRLTLVSGQCGGQNCHLDLEFTDGMTWLARLRLGDPLLSPPSLQSCVFLSEVAALKALAGIHVLAPHVYSKPSDRNGSNTKKKVRITEQLTDVHLESEKYPLPLSASHEGLFYLKHYDYKGDYILIYEEHNIAGVPGWEFASTECNDMTFSSLCMMQPVGKFYDDDNSLSEDEIRFAAMFDRYIGDMKMDASPLTGVEGFFFLREVAMGDVHVWALIQYQQQLAKETSNPAKV
ncbi:hypothetical protein O1611_g8344 [Lasiodiplodia mahajangana]|uniref:Uncharacterized protein n=1 Tax=Lasiodiplodia mahajangana TaxID=1108764 RepID=A0ACC2JCT5_9PEZI|nr:hypothetical protein O1611_g8344 [Lasiodiplodia mahajangana]